MSGLHDIIATTPESTFETAGGFDFTDEIAVKLEAYWREHPSGPVLISRMDLAWLLEGYARTRLHRDLGKANWLHDDELDMHIPTCSVPKRWPIGPVELAPMLPCGNGPLVGEQIETGDCGQHEGVSSAP